MTPRPVPPAAAPAWSGGRRFGFRAALVFFGLLSLPLDGGYWQAVFHAGWSRLAFQDLFALAGWGLQLLPGSWVPHWGWASFGHLGAALAVALLGAVVWTAVAGRTANYATANYWLRVVARYRLALGLLGYGVIKLIPLQFPEPTLSDLHTAYGDFLPWKIYYLTNGVAVAGYQSMLGAVEILAALLLLDRRTATFGAGLGAAVLINIVLVNFAYDLGDHVYATQLLLLAAFLLAHDTPRLFQLLVREKPAQADHFEPVLSSGFRRLRRIGRIAIAGWALVFGLSAYASYRRDPGLYPVGAGLPGAAGFYRVAQFAANSPAAAGAPWRDVVFERWNTLSVSTGHPVDPDRATVREAAFSPAARAYEQAGNGGRRFFSYVFDPAAATLELVAKHAPAERFKLRYRWEEEDRLVLEGHDAQGVAVSIALDRVDKRYLLRAGRRRPVTIQ